jgi:uncharacterized Ntn-hydrolase superfamily protein
VTLARTGTYSIVARDPASGEIGAAVQSHWFSVGSIVTWARPGVGAVATQSMAEAAYGPRMLDRLANGELPQPALDALTGEDAAARVRQVAAVDAEGRVAVYTGEGCIEHAGHVTGDGFSAQANMMASRDVWPAMASAYEAAEGPLSRRLLATLRAAEEAGGDVRGRQSAAMVVVAAVGEPWQRRIDLRVEDDSEPLDELARLLDLHDAYELASEADELVEKGRHEEAGRCYRRAAELAPGNEELRFWSGLSQLKMGETEEGLAVVRGVIDANDGWRQLLLRLEDDIAPGIDEVRRQLGLEP